MKKNSFFSEYTSLSIKFTILICFILVNIIVAFIYFKQLYSPIKSIYFEGDASAKTIITKIDLEQQSIANLNIQQLSSKLQNSLPLYKNEISFISPYFLKIKSSKKVLLAYLKSNEQNFILTEEGIVFNTDNKKLNLPVVILNNQLNEINSNLEVGKKLNLSLVNELLNLLHSLHHTKYQGVVIADKIAEIYISNSLNFQVILKPYNLPIFLGYDGFDSKLDKLILVLNRLNKNLDKLEKIDARYLDKIIISYK